MHIFAARAAACVLALVAAVAQAEPYRVPRTPDGQPDLQGLWTNLSMTVMERRPDTPLTFATKAEETAFETRMGQAWNAAETGGLGMGVSEWHQYQPMARIDGRLRTSWIVSPADGRLPWRPQARQRFAGLVAAMSADEAIGPEARTPSDRCLMGGLASAGPPFNNPPVAAGKLIVQTRAEIAILSEMNHDVRIVRLGGRHPPANVHVWMGDSIGRWEGATLVVETTNFHSQETLHAVFLLSPDARVTERFTRVSPVELRYAFEVDDPVNYTAVWRGEMPFVTDRGPIYEFACHEGNYAMVGILGGARKIEADATVGR